MTPWITQPVPFNIGHGAAAEAAATTYPDSFGTSGDASVAGVTIATTGQKLGDGCLDIAGTSTGVNVPVQMLPTGTQDFTYSMWINFDNFSSQMEIIRQDYEAFLQSPTGNLITGAGILVVAAHTTLSAGTWYLLQSVRKDGTETSYLNYDAHTVSTGSPSTIASSTNWFIGGRPDGSEGFDGKMDSIVIFDRALTDQERSDIYASGSPSTIEDTFTTLESRDELKLWYSCDALSGSDLINDAIPVT